MFPSQPLFAFVHSGVFALLAISTALLSGCASSGRASSRSLSEIPETYATVFLAPVDVQYDGAASLDSPALAQNAGVGFAAGLSEKGYTVVVGDAVVSDIFLASARTDLRPDNKGDSVLLEKIQNGKGRKYYAVLKDGKLADVLLDVVEFRNGLKSGTYVSAYGKVQIVESPALPAQYEASRQFGKSVVFNMVFEATDARGLVSRWTTRGERGEIKSINSADSLTSGQTNNFARQVLKELPAIQSAQSASKTETK